jgi:hypothetical protein
MALGGGGDHAAGAGSAHQQGDERGLHLMRRREHARENAHRPASILADID